MTLLKLSRRAVVLVLSPFALMPMATVGRGRDLAKAASAASALLKKYEFLKANGNSNCSSEFLESISSMSNEARLQGSCCAEMDPHRYVEQIDALREYVRIPEIPPDPYDISAELAKKLIASYDNPLTPTQQSVYEYAMSNSDEKGPCCCQCWRWKVYGGLGKFLIQAKGFDGKQLVNVWNNSNGCGGGAEHRH